MRKRLGAQGSLAAPMVHVYCWRWRSPSCCSGFHSAAAPVLTILRVVAAGDCRRSCARQPSPRCSAQHYRRVKCRVRHRVCGRACYALAHGSGGWAPYGEQKSGRGWLARDDSAGRFGRPLFCIAAQRTPPRLPPHRPQRSTNARHWIGATVSRRRLQSVDGGGDWRGAFVLLSGPGRLHDG